MAEPSVSVVERPSPPRAGHGPVRNLGPVLIGLLLLGLAALAIPPAWSWARFRRTHSLTDDAFVEAHIINIAPQMVTGRISRFLVEENDRVEPGQVLAEIDPTPYRDKVEVAKAKLETARVDLDRQRADLVRVRKEVPLRIDLAMRTLDAARIDRAKAERSLALTRDGVEKDIDEARAGVKSARAGLTLADLEFGRFTRLADLGASTQERQQQATHARDQARAQLELSEAKLAKALISQIQVDLARRSLESAQTGAEKAAKDVDLSETGNDQIREMELLVRVKELTVEEASRGLEAADHELEYTKVRAPISGVVVKRYRHLGDYTPAGATLLSLYDPDLLYVEANLEEDRLPGVAPGNPVRVEVDAFDRPFEGRVVWINKSTGAQFSLMPRNVVSGEFTRVVQRVPVRIRLERDDRWPGLRAGLSARVAIAHGRGDPAWAARAARGLAGQETRYNAPMDASAGERSRP
ncbi:HlyD family secretion protein [Singulisphaera sp. PoT]|uniref:HlyD family secretion protein n=1 Tax=Singulisphaera sp. PoT TaxID=3411797 RepID=UPI003BF5CE7F